MANLTVKKLFEDRKTGLEFELVAGSAGLKRPILRPVLQRPSFILTGHTTNFAEKRLQIMGQTEMDYLNDIPDERGKEAISTLFDYSIPALIITRGIPPRGYMVHLADKKNIPLIVSRLNTDALFNRLTVYLDRMFAPHISIHGTMMDVYGVGILYTGRAGIGKSECALALVERGHRLIADDLVNIGRIAGEVLIARGEKDAGHHLEIRGVGIVDIERLFGVRAIRIQKRVELEVHLELWEAIKDYERLGIDETNTSFLGVQIPRITIPISPGKNITAISEAIAMNHMLKVYGHHPAREFVERLKERMRRYEATDQYLESDFE